VRQDGKHGEWVEVERDINVNGVVQSERRDKKKWGGQSKVSLEFKGGGVKISKMIEARRRRKGYKEKEGERKEMNERE